MERNVLFVGKNLLLSAEDVQIFKGDTGQDLF